MTLSTNLTLSSPIILPKLVLDNTGASFWPTYAGAILVDGSAAFRCEGVDLSPFATAGNDYVLVVKDSGNNVAWGYLDVADTALAFSNIHEDDMADDDTADWSGNGTLTFDTDHYEWATNAINKVAYMGTQTFTAGKLYRITIQCKDGTASGQTFKLYMHDGATKAGPTITTTASWVTHTAYLLITNSVSGTGTFGLRESSDFGGDNIELRNFSIDEVTHVGADGALIMSTKGGTTQNWTNIDAGFNYNDASGYTFEIYRAVT